MLHECHVDCAAVHSSNWGQSTWPGYLRETLKLDGSIALYGKINNRLPWTSGAPTRVHAPMEKVGIKNLDVTHKNVITGKELLLYNQWQIQWFPIGGGMDLVGGGVDSRGGYVLKILYVKMKELGPLGGHALGAPPLDLPMIMKMKESKWKQRSPMLNQWMIFTCVYILSLQIQS